MYRDESILHSIDQLLVTLGEMVSINYESGTLDIPIRRTFVSGDRHNKLDAHNLAELWCIGPQRAATTMLATTQHGV